MSTLNSDNPAKSEDFSTTGNPSTNRRFEPSGKHRPPYVKYLFYAVLTVGICAGLYVLFNQELRAQAYEYVFKPKDDFSTFVTKKVEKEAFKVTVEAKGTIDSSRNSSLTNNVEGQTTIISIVPAGTMVQEPLRARFTTGEGIKAFIKEIRNESSRTPVVVIEERTYKRNENGELLDKSGKPLVDEDGNPVEDFDKAAYDAQLIELPPYEMSGYSEVLVEKGDEVEYEEILIGDLVCELDASTLIDAEKQQQISVTQAQADLEKGEKNVDIQKAQNESDIAEAKLQMELADLDLKKYLGMEGAKEAQEVQPVAPEETATPQEKEAEADTQNDAVSSAELRTGPELETQQVPDENPAVVKPNEGAAEAESELEAIELEAKKEGEKDPEGGEFEQERKRIAGEIELAKQELKRAQDQYEFTKRVSLKGYKTSDEVEQSLLAVNKAQFDLQMKELELNVLEKYTKERTIAELLHKKKETVRNLERVKLSGDAALVQFQAELKSRQLSYNVQMSQLERLQQQIEACKLIAPQAGQVVYANQSSRRSEPVIIEEGATVRERQKIINLPDVSAMKVDAKIHESMISDVVPSLPVLIRVDAIPSHVYKGVLETVSSVPLPGNWPNLDLKQYEAVVKILDEGEVLQQLKPGMTANVEIIVEESPEKLLQIPVQAAVHIGQTYYAWVLTEDGPERKQLELGRSNDVKFVIEKGLAEGEEVIMNPRTHFAEEIAKLEAEAMQSSQKPQFDSQDLEDQSAQSDSSERRPGKNESAGGGRPPGGGGGEGQRSDPAAFFAKLDANGDQKLSEDEIPERMKAYLADADSDGDGNISKSEFLSRRQGPGGGGGRAAGGPPKRDGNTRGAE